MGAIWAGGAGGVASALAGRGVGSGTFCGTTAGWGAACAGTAGAGAGWMAAVWEGAGLGARGAAPVPPLAPPPAAATGRTGPSGMAICGENNCSAVGMAAPGMFALGRITSPEDWACAMPAITPMPSATITAARRGRETRRKGMAWTG